MQVDLAEAHDFGRDGGDIEMAQTNPKLLSSRPSDAGEETPPATAHGRGALVACSHLCAISSQLLHGLLCMRVISFILDAIWVCCICAVPVINNIAIRFLFSPVNSAGSVSVDTFLWWCACFVALATFTYGARLLLREYIASRFTHRAHVTVARAVSKGAVWARDAATIGHNLRAARRCVLEHVPSMVRAACQTIFFLSIAYSQSVSMERAPGIAHRLVRTAFGRGDAART